MNPTNPIAFIASLLLGMLVASVSAHAMDCVPRAAILAQLAEQYGEAITHEAISSDGSVLLLTTTSKDGETFTTMMILPNGTACLLAAGKGWIDKPWVDPKIGPTL